MTTTTLDGTRHGTSRHDTEWCEGAFDHGPRSAFNAWFFGAFDRYINFVARAHKRRAFEGLGTGPVLEIGAGVGANFDHIPPGTVVHAVEPNLRMHDGLRRRARDHGIELVLIAGGAEQIPLPDGSVDDVIASLVLCTVGDPARVLDEIRRVLRPGGTFRFVEHVQAPRWGVRRTVQRAIRRPWGWVFEGCDPTRRTTTLVEQAGFSHLTLHRRKLRASLFYPVNTAVWGVATR